MSVDATVSGAFNSLKQLAQAARDRAERLATGAGYPLAQFAPRSPGLFDDEVDTVRPTAGYRRPPLELDPTAPLALPDAPALDAAPPPSRRLLDPVPEIAWRRSTLPSVKLPGARDPKDPQGRVIVGDEPPVPALDDLDPPVLTRPPQSWESPVLGGRFDSPPAPEFGAFGGDLERERLIGLKLLEPYLRPLARLDERIAQVEALLRGLDETPPYDLYENEKYAQARVDLDIEQKDARLKLERQSAGPNGLPSGEALATAVDLKLRWQHAAAKAALAARIARLELELAVLKAARALQLKLLEAAASWLTRCMDLHMKAVETALEGAEDALDLAVKLQALEKRKLEAFVAFNAMQERVFEDRYKLAASQLERLDIAIAGERLKSDYNKAAARAHKLLAGAIELKVKLYESRLDYVKADVETRALRYDICEGRLQAFAAKARLKAAEHELRKARLKSDLLEVERQLKEVERFTLAIAREEANVKAQRGRIKAQLARNRLARERHATAQRAYLEQHRLLDDAARLHLEGVVANLDAEFAGRELELQAAEDAGARGLREAVLRLERERTVATSDLKRQQLALSRASAKATTQLGLAATEAGIAKAAATGLNGLAVQLEKSEL